MKRVGVLTSSRADFGIYLQLLKKLRADPEFEIDIIAFGTHLSHFNGHTIDDIEAAGFTVKYKIENMLLTDSASSVATSMGLTGIKFADFWNENAGKFDLVFCLGDRFEMFAAVMAGVPFQVPFAHLHGGETTLGAIDNVFRHGITLASKYHFVSTNEYAQRVKELINHDHGIYHVGALGLDNVLGLELLTPAEFTEKWSIDLSRKTILVTFHPETVNYKENEHYVNELVNSIDSLKQYQVLITMPNADTSGNYIRSILTNNYASSDRVFLVENLGAVGYFTAIKNCAFLLGNTSSGIIEAASFGKYVINLGNRQKGRLSGPNVLHVPIAGNEIINAVHEIEMAPPLTNDNIYFNGGAADMIMKILKQM